MSAWATQEHEKQVYHQFERIKEDNLENDAQHIDSDLKLAGFDVHRLNLKAPLGMDPCQTIEQKVYGIKKFDKIESINQKQLQRARLSLMSESEGVRREDETIAVPKPQSNHCFCQICYIAYEDFDEHIAKESHQRRAKNQVQIQMIDELIKEMNIEEKWMNWKPDPPLIEERFTYKQEPKLLKGDKLFSDKKVIVAQVQQERLIETKPEPATSKQDSLVDQMIEEQKIDEESQVKEDYDLGKHTVYHALHQTEAPNIKVENTSMQSAFSCDKSLPREEPSENHIEDIVNPPAE